jgi:AbiV family abortive infection protein
MTDPEQTKRTINACFGHARDLLRAARRVLEAERLPNIAFHLTVLALEEIAKAALVGMRAIAVSHGDDPAFAQNRMDDHVFKLFWALWTPSFARGKVSREELEGLRGMAKDLHETRLAAMYVSPDADLGAAPLYDVSDKLARWLLGVADARLGMETSRDWQAIDLSQNSDARWLLDETEDPEKRKLIFSQKSFDKFAELGNARDWIRWVREQFAIAEAAGRESLQRELARGVPGIDRLGAEKWRVRIRLHSPAQSIRGRAISPWNKWSTWIKLATVQNDKRALDVEFTYREAMPIQALPNFSYDLARKFVAALNIGSLGFWWWDLATHTDRFYERLTDLQAADGTEIGMKMHAWPKFEWKREALEETTFNRVAMCFGMIVALGKGPYEAFVWPYLTGLAMIAKSDLHLHFAPQVCERMATCLLEAMRHFGDWSGEEATIGTALTGFFSPAIAKVEDVDDLASLLFQARQRSSELRNVTLDRAASLKVLCDAYLIKRFEKMAERELENTRDKEVTTTDAIDPAREPSDNRPGDIDLEQAPAGTPQDH